MASRKVTGSGDGLITVQEYAERFRVDTAIVRGWIRGGHIRATLVGPRMMRLESDDSMQPVVPTRAGMGLNVAPGDTVGLKREQLVGFLIAFQGMDRDIARSVVEGMEPDDINREHAEYGGNNNQPF